MRNVRYRVARLGEHLLRPVDGASSAAFRVLFGLTMAFGLVRFVAEGWVPIIYSEPSVFFKYPGLSFVRVWPEWGMYLHFAVLAVLAVFIAIGFFYRASVALFFAGFTYLQLIDVTNYLNHYYLVVLLAGLMIFLPLHRSWSLDAKLRPRIRSDYVPTWVLYLLRFQIAVVYFHAALAKLGTDWLLHAQPMNIWMNARTETPIIGAFLGEPSTAYLLSWVGFLYDATIVGWLLWPKSRPFAYAVVVVFHFLTQVFFDIGMFPAIMVTSTLIFFSASWPRKLIALLRRSSQVPAPQLTAPLRAPSRTAISLIAAYCLFQALFPLRHYAYPGDVLWTEEGMRFAWKVMVREKNGALTYHVRSREEAREWQVNPRRYLTPRQANEMASQPDLILQLAHHIKEDFARSGRADVEVRAEAWVSLNGRKAALLIDPEVDLTQVEDGIMPARWIRAAPNTEPALLRAPPRVAVR